MRKKDEKEKVVKNLGGRPREHDREQIAKDLIEWSKKSDSTNLNAFCASIDLAPSMITNWARECDSFRRAYETAKAHLGARRERYLHEDKLHVKAYDLNAAVYDHFLKDERRMQAEFENKLKSDVATLVSDADKTRHEETMAQLRLLQSQRKIDNNNNKEATKSD